MATVRLRTLMFIVVILSLIHIYISTRSARGHALSSYPRLSLHRSTIGSLSPFPCLWSTLGSHALGCPLGFPPTPFLQKYYLRIEYISSMRINNYTFEYQFIFNCFHTHVCGHTRAEINIYNFIQVLKINVNFYYKNCKVI